MTPERIAEIRTRLAAFEPLVQNVYAAWDQDAWDDYLDQSPTDITDLLAELDRLGAENEALAEVADNCRQLTWDPGTGSLGINLEQNVRLKAALDALERIGGVD
jgi:hypothetical protein